MGSPENYYGVFGLTRGLTTSETQVVPVNTPSSVSATNKTANTPNTSTSTNWTAGTGGTGTVTFPTVLSGNEADGTSSAARYAYTTTNNATLELGNFGLTTGLAANQSVTGITGLVVQLDDAYVSATCASSRIRVNVSYNGGTTWTTSTNQTATLNTSGTTVDTTMGATGNMSAWTFASHTWDNDDFDQANFKVRLTGIKGCATAGTQIRLDQLRVSAYYTINTATTTTTSSRPISRTLTSRVPGRPAPWACPTATTRTVRT